MKKKFTKKKASRVWNELFSPPCPKCGSTDTTEELRDIPAMGTGAEMIKKLVDQMKGKPIKPTRTWTCQKCHTVFDEKGRSIRFGK